jgi:hypothetical protein
VTVIGPKTQIFPVPFFCTPIDPLYVHVALNVYVVQFMLGLFHCALMILSDQLIDVPFVNEGSSWMFPHDTNSIAVGSHVTSSHFGHSSVVHPHPDVFC